MIKTYQRMITIKLLARAVFIFRVMCCIVLISACDDETSGLQPVSPQIGGTEVEAGSLTMGGTMINPAGTEAGNQEVDMMITNCDDCTNENCPDISCLCPDGRSASFSGCVGSCCVEESQQEAACRDLCSTLPTGECASGETRCLP